MRMFVLAALLLGVLCFPKSAMAGAPVCHTHSAGPYCQYTGRVVKAYVNQFDSILIYFDAPVDLANVQAVGISGVSVSSAALVKISSNEKFADYFYSSILSAQARGATVTLQMRGSQSGYLLVDRIWVNE